MAFSRALDLHNNIAADFFTGIFVAFICVLCDLL